MTKDKIQRIEEMRNEGATVKEITAALGIAPSTINYWLRRLRKAGRRVAKGKRTGRKPLEL